jgi:hypothetical protein
MNSTPWLLGGVGGVIVNRPDPGLIFDDSLPSLKSFGILIGNCEGAFTHAPQFAPSAGWRVVSG